MQLKLIIAHLTFLQEKRRSSEGFTLIELLVVIIILGIMSAIAIPSIMGQVGKAREAEAKEVLSAIGQSQQAYFFEKATFADTIAKLDLAIVGKYYNFPNPTIVDTSKVKHQASALNAAASGTRNYGLGVYHAASGDFAIVLCQSDTIGGAAVAPDTNTDPCISGTKLQ